jgi:hypothetical protein
MYGKTRLTLFFPIYCDFSLMVSADATRNISILTKTPGRLRAL